MTISGHSVLLSEAAERFLIDTSADAQSTETGGVLLGLRLNGRPWIVAAKFMSGRRSGFSYEIPGGATSRVVDEARVHEPRIGYLGDWHSHPADVGPSPRDLRTLDSLSRGATHGARVIAIVRRTSAGWVVEVWDQPEPRAARRCQIVRTGGLSAIAV